MKVVSQDGGVATEAFVADEVKPIKGLHLPLLLDAVGARYHASKVPTLDEARTSGAKFQNCWHVNDDRRINVGEISFHNDAVSVVTSDTLDSEIVLDDILGWRRNEFQFRKHTTPPIRFFQSDLVVRFDNEPANAFEALSSFFGFIQEEMYPSNAHIKKPIGFSVIAFGTDPTITGPSPEFTIARRINVPWRLGLYFSKAHMKTSSHVRALELLDELLGKKG